MSLRDTPVMRERLSLATDVNWEEDCENSSIASDDPDTVRSLEYMAEKWVVTIVLWYWFGAHLLGFVVIFAYLIVYSELFTQYGISTWWHALYMTTSGFQNNGLLLTPNSIEPFAECPVVLITVGLLIAGGNTCLAIAVRILTWVIWR